MTSWKEFAAEQPELAERVRSVFGIGKHKTLATLRRDGSPRISGIEVEFADDGELVLGMMPGSLKAQDLQRDPRLAVHSPSLDPPDDPSTWVGDVKISGRAREVGELTGPVEGHRFVVDLTEVASVRVGTPADHLVIESWHPGRGYERRTRT